MTKDKESKKKLCAICEKNDVDADDETGVCDDCVKLLPGAIEELAVERVKSKKKSQKRGRYGNCQNCGEPFDTAFSERFHRCPKKSE